jgi:hypothetical protein
MQTVVQKTEKVYEEGCDRGAIILVAKLSDRPVNEEPRFREVAGFFRFRVDLQGFTRRRPLDPTAERALRQTARAPVFHFGRASGRELSDSLSENIDPVNNPVGFASRRQPFHKCCTHGIAGGGTMLGPEANRPNLPGVVPTSSARLATSHYVTRLHHCLLFTRDIMFSPIIREILGD